MLNNINKYILVIISMDQYGEKVESFYTFILTFNILNSNAKYISHIIQRISKPIVLIHPKINFFFVIINQE